MKIRPRRKQKSNLIPVYQELCNSYRAIDDFRAKLLGLLPLATGTGIFLLFSDSDKIVFVKQFFPVIGLFGILITLGLFFYELYGIKKCTSLIFTGIDIENRLNIFDGQFNKRPPGVFGLINEPLAAGVIYPAVLAAWTFIAFDFDICLKLSDVSLFTAISKFWAIKVFIIGFTVSFLYNLFLIRRDIRKSYNKIYNNLVHIFKHKEKLINSE